jgi:hypothetical protein
MVGKNTDLNRNQEIIDKIERIQTTQRQLGAGLEYKLMKLSASSR